MRVRERDRRERERWERERERERGSFRKLKAWGWGKGERCSLLHIKHIWCQHDMLSAFPHEHCCVAHVENVPCYVYSLAKDHKNTNIPITFNISL